VVPGILLAAGTALSSVAGVSVVKAVAGYRRTRSLQLGALAYAAFDLLFLAALWIPRSWLVPYASAAWLLFVAGSKLFYPIAGALSEALPPREARAGYMAMYQYAFTTAQILAPLVVGLFAVRAWLPWATVTASAFLALLLLHRLGADMPSQHNRARATTPHLSG
jgi:MFS family permease